MTVNMQLHKYGESSIILLEEKWTLYLAKLNRTLIVWTILLYADTNKQIPRGKFYLLLFKLIFTDVFSKSFQDFREFVIKSGCTW